MSLSTGEKLRDKGCSLAAGKRPVKTLRIRLAILEKLLQGDAITIDDVLPDDGSKRSNNVGAALLALSRKRLICRTGKYRISPRELRHGGFNPEWIAIDGAACRAEHARLAAELEQLEPLPRQGELFPGGQ